MKVARGEAVGSLTCALLVVVELLEEILRFGLAREALGQEVQTLEVGARNDGRVWVIIIWI